MVTYIVLAATPLYSHIARSVYRNHEPTSGRAKLFPRRWVFYYFVRAHTQSGFPNNFDVIIRHSALQDCPGLYLHGRMNSHKMTMKVSPLFVPDLRFD